MLVFRAKNKMGIKSDKFTGTKLEGIKNHTIIISFKIISVSMNANEKIR